MLYIYFAITVFSPLREVQDITIAQNKTNKIDRGIYLTIILVHWDIRHLQDFHTYKSLILQKTLGTDGYLAPLPNIQLLCLADNKITSLKGLAGFADSMIILNIQNNR
ncbi:unnamed protein product [Coregonus sp. 'balchen']|nr:unnamed protein product [Coregonus sp. 'balchen']